MKKALLVLGVGLVLAGTLTGCKRTYVCECTYTVLGETVTGESDSFVATKKQANEKCKSIEQDLKDNGFSDASCTPKKQ